VDTGRLNGWRIKVTTLLHSVSLLRIRGTYRQSVCVFMTWYVIEVSMGRASFFCTEDVDKEESEFYPKTVP
jgi:hypothetical protein